MNHLKPVVCVRAALNRRVRVCLFVLLTLIFVTTPVAAEPAVAPDWLPALLEKESVTIVITDSGLGGLSVLADAAEKFSKQGTFKHVKLVFVNALFSDQFGYNGLQTRAEKLMVFSSALQSMQDRYAPDIILVACNTLSVLVPDTAFAKASSVPVVGIVEEGVEQIAEQLSDKPSARNIIFATKTTVDEGTHKNLLLAQGFTDTQIMTQSCPQLTQHIEQGYDSEYTEMLIDAYVDEALSGMDDTTGPLSVSFNCTHFGYAMEAWRLAFDSRGIAVNEYLDPNRRMVDFLLPESLNQRYLEPEITVKVVSMIDIPQDRQDSIGRWLHSVSPMTETALYEYEMKADLFEWRDLTPVSKN